MEGNEFVLTILMNLEFLACLVADIEEGGMGKLLHIFTAKGKSTNLVILFPL